MTPLVSILVPAYNAAPWLSETLASAVSQTWPRKEVIVVDDGSTDDTLTAARAFESATVKVVAAVHAGQTASLNRALQEAQGDFIQFLDADDLIEPNKISKQVARLVGERADMLATSRWARFYRNDPSTAEFAEHPDFRDYADPVDWLIQSWGGEGTMPPVAWLLPRRVVETSGPFDANLSLNNDTEYFTRVVLRSTGLAFCGESVAYYRSGNASLSGRRTRPALESFFLACRLSAEHVLAVEDSPRTRRACANLWQHFAYWTFPEATDLVDAAEASVASFGGASLQLSGSKPFVLARVAIGWRAARRIQVGMARWRRGNAPGTGV